jgi:RimJ/RimL family protein N-acetyltransferase
VSHPYWPLFDLRLRSTDLELRPMTEADLTPLSDLLTEDLEQDPSATTYDIDDPHVSRGIILHQAYWKGYGTWRPEAWRLNFTVRHDGEVIGTQELEGNDFPTLGVVDSASFLASDARGRGWGKQMRTAVLALAFGPLEARAAMSSAWHDNHASLGVSRSLGYQPNGESYHRRDSSADILNHLMIKRGAWLAGGLATQVEVTGFEPCRPLFGLGRRAESP